MKAAVSILLLCLMGCAQTPRSVEQSAHGYGAASTTTTDADGNTVTTITPPTPAEEALAKWVQYGAIMGVIGILTMLPVFGGNVRTGAVIAVGGAGMAATGHFLGSMTLDIPAWFLPALVGIMLAAGMLWGWHVSEGQAKAKAKAKQTLFRSDQQST